MLKFKKILLLAISIIIVFTIVLLALHKKSNKAVIEGKSGPYIEMGAQLNGLIKLEGDKVLVSSRKQGLYTFDPINNWKKLNIESDIGEIVSIAEFNDEIAISTKDNKLITFKKNELSETQPIKIEAASLSVPLQKISKCQNKLIGLSNDGIFEIDKNNIIKYKNSDIIPQAIDCNDNTMLVGTRSSGVYSCSLSNKACASFVPKSSFVDVRGVLWDEHEKTWFAGVYGSPATGTSITKLVNNKWEPLCSYIGDIVNFYKDATGRFKYALIESGFLFEYSDNKFKKKDISNALSPYYAEISPDKFYAISFGNLISYEKGIVKSHGTPILLEQVDEKQRYGNTYVWDIEIVDKDVAFSATSMIGVWWSSNGGANWQPINNGLDDPKVHFIKFNKKYNLLVAGTHGKGLFTCGLPCKKWEYINDERFANADLEDAVEIDENRYAIASEHGAFIYDVGKKAIEAHIPLSCKIQMSSDLWTVSKINKEIFFGVYAGNDCLSGVWELKPDNKFEKRFDINEAVTGIINFKGTYYISTLKSLNKCIEGKCLKIHDLMVNRISLVDNILWLATSKGMGFIDLAKNEEKVTWVFNVPSQVVKVLDNEKNILLVGTIDSGVIRIRME